MQYFHNSVFSAQASDWIADLLSDRMRVAAELLIIGVAFQKSGRVWQVISHEGDDLGELSTHVVNTVTHVLKRMGYKNDCVTRRQLGEMDSVTFGHRNQFDLEEIEMMIARRRRRPPVSIH